MGLDQDISKFFDAFWEFLLTINRLSVGMIIILLLLFPFRVTSQDPIWDTGFKMNGLNWTIVELAHFWCGWLKLRYLKNINFKWTDKKSI